MKRAATEADRLGFWGYVMPDHYMWGPDRGGDSTLDTWVALTYLAAVTEKIHLGTLVTPIPLRPPGMLAKMASTLDVISRGRVVLGVGAGWSQTEFEGYSVWDEPKIRVDKTEEGLELILKLWREKKVTFDGKHYHARNAVLEPKPLHKPHPRLLFAGFKPRMLRLAGKYADLCFILLGSDPGGRAENGFAEAKRIVLKEAEHHSRKNRISFASGSPRPDFGSKYDREQYVNKVEKAQKDGCAYFVTPFPFETYLDSVRDFAKNVIPSF